MESRLVELKRQLVETEEELCSLQQDRDGWVKGEMALQLSLEELDQRMALFTKEEAAARAAMDRITQEIVLKEGQLFELVPKLEMVIILH